MRIFVAGATGAISKRLVPLLVADGHYILASTRTPNKAEDLRAQGASPVVLDGLNKDAVMDAIEIRSTQTHQNKYRAVDRSSN